MKELTLPPSKILSGTITVPKIDKLNKYYDLISDGRPVISPYVVHSDIYCPHAFVEELEFMLSEKSDFERKIKVPQSQYFKRALLSFKEQGVHHILVDGTHRSRAYTLHEQEIPVREIENYEDLKFLKEECLRKGQPCPGIVEFSGSFEKYLFSLYRAVAEGTLRTIEMSTRKMVQENSLRREQNKWVYDPNLPF